MAQKEELQKCMVLGLQVGLGEGGHYRHISSMGSERLREEWCGMVWSVDKLTRSV